MLFYYICGFWLLILLKFCRQSDFLLSRKSFEGLKLSVEPLDLLTQVDVVVLEGKGGVVGHRGSGMSRMGRGTVGVG